MSQEDVAKLIPEFKTKLFADLGLEKLPEEEKEKFLQKLDTTISETIFNTVMANLSESQMQALEVKLKTDISDEEKTQIVLEAAQDIPDLEKKITAALEKLYQKMQDFSKKFDAEH